MKRYLLCELNDENYTEPMFTVFDSHKDALKAAIKRCAGIGYHYDSDFELECKDNRNRISITFTENPYGNGDNFYVTEIKEFDSNDGGYILVWHHAYNGVGFDIECVGSYEECKLEMKKCIQKRKKQIECDLEWEDELQSCVDTGDEWEIWSIVKLRDCEHKEK